MTSLMASLTAPLVRFLAKEATMNLAQTLVILELVSDTELVLLLCLARRYPRRCLEALLLLTLNSTHAFSRGVSQSIGEKITTLSNLLH